MNGYQATAAKRRLQLRVNRVSQLFNIKPKSYTSLAIILFFLVGVFYVVVVNVVATKGTDLRLMDSENRQLEGENQRLEVEAARLKSLKVINESATGEVEVGDEATGSAAEPASGEAKPVTGDSAAGQPITYIGENGEISVSSVAAVEPKLVPQKAQKYLPSYSGALAQR